MRKWYTMIPDGTCDKAIRNNKTGEIEAIIARAWGERKWIRFLKNQNNEWERAAFAAEFPNLKAVKDYYDRVNA